MKSPILRSLPIIPASLRFLMAFNESANCPRLFELRNEAKRQGATKDEQNVMMLRDVTCFTDTPKRLR